MTDPATNDAEARLRPYLPRLALQWIEGQPGSTFLALDGSLVFVDISGFTKMSERLARHGKVGAEEVTDVLGAVFARMLAVAYADGGGLLKFGGDALLVWFSGDEHSVRAARAAHGMRGTLRSIGRIETTAGKVTLRMSVGVNSGLYHFFLVGRSHREFLVTGPAATGTVLMESTATAGEILLGPATAEALPEKVLGAVKGPGRLLRSEPPGLSRDVADAELSTSGLDLVPFVSTGLRESVLAGTEPEHRAATVAFIHFDGTDALIQEHGPQAAADALGELVGDVQDAVDDQGLTFLSSDVDADGGKLILTAGVPRVLGDDEERMLLALRRIVDGERRIPIRVGVNHGAVFAGDVGPPYRRTYTVMGDTVNLAARLMAKAGPGEIYATAGVLDRSATRFELTELEPFMVKGKARPVEAWSVGEAIGSRARSTGTQERLPLIGRETEMGTLESALASARSGQGRLMELIGEPGIGKTRLLEELRERAEGFRVLHATAEAYTSSTPYVVWRELLRELLDVGWEAPDEVVLERLYPTVEEVDADLMPWLPLLANVLDVDVAPSLEVELLAPEFRRPKLHETVGRFLGGLLDSPTLIEIEDAHQMDEASADLLTGLVGPIGRAPWLAVVTRRDDGAFAAPDVPEVLRFELAPLAPESVRELAHAATEETPLPPHVMDIVTERSAGNPQFLLDLIQAATSSDGGSLPESVEAAAMAQIDMLAPGDRALVRRASVLGLSFHPRSLEGMLDEDESPPDESTWERLSGLVEDEGEGYLRFRRAVVRDAAYSGLPFRTRRRLHGLVGARFEREAGEDVDELAGVLSLHFFLAQEYKKAWHYARTAGERAAAVYANVEAARLLMRAVEAGKHVEEVTGHDLALVHEARGDVLDLAGEFRRAADAYSSARKLVHVDPVAEARLLLKRSEIEEKLGRYPQALRWATRGDSVLRAVAGPEAAKLQAEIGAWYATVLQGEGRNSEAFRWADRAAERARASGNRYALARAYSVLDRCNVALGRPAGRYWASALGIYEELGNLVGQARILGNLGFGAFYDGRWDEALEYYERCREVALKTGNLSYATQAADNIAEILCERGEYERAESLLRDSVRVWRASEYGFFLGACLEYLGRVMSRTGRFEDALLLFNESRTAYLRVGAQEDTLLIDVRIAECRTLMGEASIALTLLEEVQSRADTGEEGESAASLLGRVRGYALAQTGDLLGAERAFQESLSTGRARGDDYEVALTLQGLVWLAWLRGRPVSGEHLAEAAAILKRLGVTVVPKMPMPSRATTRK